MASFGYDIFVVPDAPDAAPPAPPARLLRIEDAACEAAGFVDLNPFITRRKRPARVSAWERGLYALTVLHPGYRHVWFIEEDVFIPRLDTLARIDARYPSADLLCGLLQVNRDGDRSWWGWFRHVPERILPLPWARSMVCGVRLSGTLLGALPGLLAAHPDLAPAADGTPRYFFIEYLFTTLALHRALSIVVAPELAGLEFRRDWRLEEIQPDRLYHPVKDLGLQAAWRAGLAEQAASATSPAQQA